MSLANMKLPTFTMEVGGVEVTFNALSFSDLTKLIANHRDELDEIVSNGKAALNSGTSNIIVEMLMRMPDVGAEIIALSAGEPESIDVVKRFTFPTQVLILSEVVKLTFNEVGGVGKFVELATSLMQLAATSLSNSTGITNSVNE